MQPIKDKMINNFRQPTWHKCNVVCRAGKLKNMLQIKIRIGNAELEYSEPFGDSGYPRIVTPDRYSDGKSKSERLVDVIKEMVEQVIKMNNSTSER